MMGIIMIGSVEAGIIEDFLGLLGFKSPKVDCSLTTETNCNNGKCTLTLYSGTRYVPENGKCVKIEDSTGSLKEYYNVIYLEKDPKFEITVEDFTYKHIDLKVKIKDSEKLKKDIPMRVNGHEVTKVKLDKLTDKKVIRYNVLEGNNVLRYNYSFGEGSTSIILQDANTENLDDTYIYENLPDANYDNAGYFYLLAVNGGGYDRYGMLKFNITQIPPGQNVDDAMLYLYMSSELIDTDEEYHTDAHHYYNQTWDESDPTWNNMLGDSNYNATYESRWTVTGINPVPDAPNWVNWTVTNLVKKDYDDGNGNASIWIRVVHSAGTPGATDYIALYTKEGEDSAKWPYLNITYSEGGATTTTTTVPSNCWTEDTTNNVIIIPNACLYYTNVEDVVGE